MPAPPVKIPQTRPRLPGEWLMVATAYSLVAGVTLWPLAAAPGSRLTGPFGDPLLNAWILAWDADRLLHGLSGWWQAPQFYPAADTLAWSEHLLGIAIFTAPVLWITGDTVLGYNLALLGSVVLAGSGMYLLARDLSGRRDAALLAGLAYACLPYRAAQITHLQVLVNGWMPVALWGLHRYFRARDRRGLAVFVLAYLLQALSNGYFLFFLIVPAGIVCIAEGVPRLKSAPTHTWSRLARDFGLAGLVIALVLSPVGLAYMRARADHGLVRSRGDMVHYSATATSYGTVPVSLRLWRHMLPVGKPERELFPGALLTTGALLGLMFSSRRRPAAAGNAPARRTALTYATIALAGFILTLGPEPVLGPFGRFSTGPWDWLAALLPGFDGLRVPARFAVVVYLGLSVLAALGAASVLGRLPSRLHRTVLAAAIAAGIVAEGWSAPIATSRFPTPGMAVERAAYEWLATQPRGPMVELPVGDTAEGTRYLYWTLTHGNRIVNGYSGYGWPLEHFIAGPPSTEPEQAGELIRLGRALGLRYLVLHEHLFADRRQGDEMARALRAQADQLQDTRSFGTTWVYTLKPMRWSSPAPPGPPIPPSADLSASHNREALRLLQDGDTATRWLSGPPQDGTEWIEVRLDRPRRLAFLRMDYARRSLADYPRELEVAVAVNDGFETVFSGGVVAELGTSIAGGDAPPGIGIALPGIETTAVRLRQTGRTPRQWYWSIHELRLWEQP